MKRTLLVCLALAGMALAGSKSYAIRLLQPAMFGNAELKAGEYRVEVMDQKAVVRSGKVNAEAPVKVETSDTKFDRTTVRMSEIGGKMRITEIRVGGGKTRLVFSE